MAVSFPADGDYIQIRSPNQVDLLDQTEGAEEGCDPVEAVSEVRNILERARKVQDKYMARLQELT